MPVYVALRTYSLALSLSLSPSLLPFLVDLVAKRRSNLSALQYILTRELRYDGFASAITVALAGGNAIRCLADKLASLFRTQLTPPQKTFISTLLSSTVGLALLQSGRQRWRRLQRPGMSTSLTLDLTMLLFVRALDVLLQLSISRVQLPRLRTKESKERQDRRSLTSRIDAFIFWACSARQASFPYACRVT